MVTTTAPGLWPGGWSIRKTTSKGVTILTAKRGSLEKHRTGPEKKRWIPKAGKKGRSCVGVSEHVVRHPVTPLN